MSAIELLLDVIQAHIPASIKMWEGAALEAFRRVGNTNRGAIGEEFVRRYLTASGISVEQSPVRTDPVDMCISGENFEVKTSSLGANGSFQFNHIRLDKDYRYLLCIGVCPDAIMFGAWRKGELSEGAAGKLVRMAEGQAITFKLTKKLTDLHPVEELPGWIKTTIA